MNGTEISELYNYSSEAVEYMAQKEYTKVYLSLRDLTKYLMNKKKDADLLWKLRIAELIALGVNVPLQMFGVYGVELKRCPPEILEVIDIELRSLQKGIESLIVSSSKEVFSYKMSLN